MVSDELDPYLVTNVSLNHAGAMQDDFKRAFDAARVRYSTTDWSNLPSSEQTTAIYKELRRLDAEAAARSMAQDATIGTSAYSPVKRHRVKQRHDYPAFRLLVRARDAPGEGGSSRWMPLRSRCPGADGTQADSSPLPMAQSYSPSSTWKPELMLIHDL